MRALILLSAFSFLTVFSNYTQGNARTPNDPLLGKQWWLENSTHHFTDYQEKQDQTLRLYGNPNQDIGWDELQKVKTTFHPVTIAVLDSGLNTSHPEFEGKIAPGGWNAIYNNSNIEDDDESAHGTHVSGIMVAGANNGIGIAGVAGSDQLPIRILPIKVLSNEFSGQFMYRNRLFSEYVARGIQYAIHKKVDIIHMSLSWPKLADSEMARTAIREAHEKGILVIASAGNQSRSQPSFPCSYTEVLCVGASNIEGKLSVYSEFGGRVDLLAPGDGILSTSFHSGYDTLSGTSQAAPMVSAIAAILVSAHPEWTPLEIKAAILASTRPTLEDHDQSQSLFGNVSIPKNLDFPEQAILIPHWKDSAQFTLDAKTLTTSGAFEFSTFHLPQLSKKDLSIQLDSQNASFTLQLIKEAAHPSGHLSRTYQVQWISKPLSLEQSMKTNLSLSILRPELTRSFKTEIILSRSFLKLSHEEHRYPKTAQAWSTSANHVLTLKLKPILIYPQHADLPLEYFQTQTQENSQGTTLTLVRPEIDRSLPKSIFLPDFNSVIQVIRLDANLDGVLDWVIIGSLSAVSSGQAKPLLRFGFYDQQFKRLPQYPGPLSIEVDERTVNALVRSYAEPGSWWSDGQRLLPAFMGVDTLPVLDNYSALDKRSKEPSRHLILLKPTSKNPNQLEMRALDSAKFRSSYPNFKLLQMIPESVSALNQGRLRISALDSDENLRWFTVSPTGEAKLSPPQPHENPLHFAGSLLPLIGTQHYALTRIHDESRAAITSLESNQITEVEYQSLLDPMLEIFAAFQLEQNLFSWGLSRTQWVALHDRLTVPTISAQRDRSFSVDDFLRTAQGFLISPEQPGLLIDSSLTQMNHLHLVVSQNNSITEPLRYSFEVPDDCTPILNHTHRIALACREADDLIFRWVDFRKNAGELK